MANATTIITDLSSVITTGPNAATLAKAIAATAQSGGGIMDYQGNVNLLKLKAQEMSVLIGRVIANTDSTDSANLTLLQNIQSDLV